MADKKSITQSTRRLKTALMLAASLCSPITLGSENCEEYAKQGIMRLINNLGLTPPPPRLTRCEKQSNHQKAIAELDNTYISEQHPDASYRASVDEQSESRSYQMERTRAVNSTMSTEVEFKIAGERTVSGNVSGSTSAIETLPSYQSVSE